jgi:hypothetical protein
MGLVIGAWRVLGWKRYLILLAFPAYRYFHREYKHSYAFNRGIPGTFLFDNPAITESADPKSDRKPKGKYYTDAFECRAILVPQEKDWNPELRGSLEEPPVVRLGNALFSTWAFRFELFVTGLFTGNWRPPGRYPFRTDSPPVGIWRVEYSSDTEICLRWKCFGAEGRTWLQAIPTNEPVVTESRAIPYYIRFGSALWPYSVSSPLDMYQNGCSIPTRVMTELHLIYSRWLIAQANRQVAREATSAFMTFPELNIPSSSSAKPENPGGETA